MYFLGGILFAVLSLGGLAYSVTSDDYERIRAFTAERAAIGNAPVVPSAQAEEIATGLMPKCSLEGIAGGGTRGRAWLSASDIQLLEVTSHREILARGLAANLWVTLPVQAPSVRLLEEVAVALTSKVEACRSILHVKEGEQQVGPTTIPNN